jgi:hypothetical protein
MRIAFAKGMHLPHLATLSASVLFQLAWTAAAHAQSPEQTTGKAVVTNSDGTSTEAPITYVPMRPSPMPAAAPSWHPLAEPAPATRIDSPPARKWYGGQTLLADGVAMAVLLGSTAAHSSGGMIVGATGLSLATPIVHAAHGRPGFMWASIGMRSATLMLAVITICKQTSFGQPNSDGHAYGTQTSCGRFEDVPIVFAGFGTAAAMIDSALFAWQDTAAAPVPTLAPKTTASKPSRVSLDGAGVLPLSSGAAVTLAGWF